MWLPEFACACGRPLLPDDRQRMACCICGVRVVLENGLYRAVDPARLAACEPFLAQYRIVRERDGYRNARAEYYRALPSPGRDDPQWSVWQIRQRSFDRLCRRVIGRRVGLSVLDLGAGSGWLSRRLADRGLRAVAVDLLADDRDGLGASRHYEAAFACVQADFDAPPFSPRQFDLVVFNGSLHYAPDVHATLRHAASMLRGGGRLVVIDSPMFESEADGAAMRQRDRDRLRTRHGLASPIQPGEGFLTFARLATAAASTGRPSPRFFATDDGWRRRLMRIGAAVGMTHVKPARFGVWVAA